MARQKKSQFKAYIHEPGKMKRKLKKKGKKAQEHPFNLCYYFVFQLGFILIVSKIKERVIDYFEPIS